MSFSEDDNENGTFHRKFRRESKVNAVAAIEREMREFLPHVVRNSGHTAKVIALFTESTPRTVENWEQGQNLPSAPKLIVLAARYPELRQKLNEWMDAITGESGVDPARVLNEIERLLEGRLR